MNKILVIALAAIISACTPSTETSESRNVQSPQTSVNIGANPAWRRIHTINNCHIYELNHAGEKYLIVTGNRRSGSSSYPVAISCAIEKIDQ